MGGKIIFIIFALLGAQNTFAGDSPISPESWMANEKLTAEDSSRIRTWLESLHGEKASNLRCVFSYKTVTRAEMPAAENYIRVREQAPIIKYQYDEVSAACEKKPSSAPICAPKKSGSLPLGFINDPMVSQLNDAVSKFANPPQYGCQITCARTDKKASVEGTKPNYLAGFCGLHSLYFKIDDKNFRYDIRITPQASARGIQYSPQEESVSLTDPKMLQRNFGDVSVDCEEKN